MSVQRIFFFSSRRRHTRSKRDWSSDVCSSDLVSIGVVHGKPSTVVNVNLLLVLDGASFSSMSVSRIRPVRLSAVVVVVAITPLPLLSSQQSYMFEQPPCLRQGSFAGTTSRQAGVRQSTRL